MPRGYSHPLFILPFDHRASFESRMFGFKPPLSAAQTAEIAAAKRVIYDAFLAAVADGVPRRFAGILTDEQFGAAILRDAAAASVTTAMCTEKSGQAEFDFEYGADFAAHIAAFDPTFCKVLVRYNPEGDRAMNQRQAARLRQLSDFLIARNKSLFMFELLVPAEPAQLEQVHRDKKAYDQELRPGLMRRAIAELQSAGVEPDLWKVEGLDRQEDYEGIVSTARAGGRDSVGCIVLGRGEDEAAVRRWLTVAGSVSGFVGFAVGRTVFWDPVSAWRSGKMTRDQAIAEMARRYQGFTRDFESTGAHLDVAAAS